jgi:hypothetical protein
LLIFQLLWPINKKERKQKMQTNKIEKKPLINTILTNPIQSLGTIRVGLFLSLLMVSQPSLAMESKSKPADETSEQIFSGANNSSSSAQANTQENPQLNSLRLQANTTDSKINQPNIDDIKKSIKETKDPEKQGDGWMEVAKLYEKIGNSKQTDTCYVDAERCYRDAERCYRDARRTEKIKEALYARAKIAIKTNDPESLAKIISDFIQLSIPENGCFKKIETKPEHYIKIELFFKEALLESIEKDDSFYLEQILYGLKIYQENHNRSAPSRTTLNDVWQLVNKSEGGPSKKILGMLAHYYKKIADAADQEESCTNLETINSVKNLKEIYDLLEPKITEKEKFDYVVKKINTINRLVPLLNNSIEGRYKLFAKLTPDQQTSEKIKLLENLAGCYKSAGEDYLWLAAKKPEKALAFLADAEAIFKSLASAEKTWARLNNLAQLETDEKSKHMRSFADALMDFGNALKDLSRYSQTHDERSDLRKKADERFELARKGYFFCGDRKSEADARIAKSKNLEALANDLVGNPELYKKTKQNQIRELILAKNIYDTLSQSPPEDVFSKIPKYGYQGMDIKDESTWDYLKDKEGNIKPKDYSIDPMDAY